MTDAIKTDQQVMYDYVWDLMKDQALDLLLDFDLDSIVRLEDIVDGLLKDPLHQVYIDDFADSLSFRETQEADVNLTEELTPENTTRYYLRKFARKTLHFMLQEWEDHYEVLRAGKDGYSVQGSWYVVPSNIDRTDIFYDEVYEEHSYCTEDKVHVTVEPYDTLDEAQAARAEISCSYAYDEYVKDMI